MKKLSKINGTKIRTNITKKRSFEYFLVYRKLIMYDAHFLSKTTKKCICDKNFDMKTKCFLPAPKLACLRMVCIVRNASLEPVQNI